MILIKHSEEMIKNFAKNGALNIPSYYIFNRRGRDQKIVSMKSYGRMSITIKESFENPKHILNNY